MKYKVLIFLILLIIFSCESNTEKKFKLFENEFKKHIGKADKKTLIGGLVEKIYYEKNNMIIGFEIYSNGEFGNSTRKYFLNKNQELIKVIERRNFYNYYEGAYDSIFKILLSEKKIITYSSKKDSIEINNKKLIEEIEKNFKFYKNDYLKSRK